MTVAGAAGEVLARDVKLVLKEHLLAAYRYAEPFPKDRFDVIHISGEGRAAGVNDLRTRLQANYRFAVMLRHSTRGGLGSLRSVSSQ